MITKNKSLFLTANIPSLIDEVNEDISFWENVVKQYPNSYETMYPEKRMFLGNRGKYHDKYIYSVSEVLNQLNDLKEFIFNLDLEETKKELWSKMRYKQDGTFDKRNRCILIELPFVILNPKNYGWYTKTLRIMYKNDYEAVICIYNKFTLWKNVKEID